MRRLLHCLGKYKKEAICAPLFKMLEATLELLIPLLVARMIDIGVGNQDTGYLLRMGLLMVLFGAVGFAFAIVAQYFAARAATLTGTALRNDLFAHLQTLSWRQIDDMGTATLITRMSSDINTVQSGVNMFLRLFLRSPFVVFGAMALAFTVDVKSALTFVVVIPVLLLVVFAILLATMPLYRQVQQHLDSIMRKTRENLLGVRVVRAFNRQADEKASFEASAENLYRRQIFVGKISALLNPVTYIIINLGIVAILKIGGAQVNAGRMQTGEVVAQVNYMSTILVELIKLANFIILLSRASASMNRVDSIMQTKNTRADGAAPFVSTGHGASIDFEHVTFSYTDHAAPALTDISFHLEAGRTLGIIGGTGAGKSTLINLLPRFYDAESGRVLVNGRPVQDYREAELRGAIGLVPQKAVLFAGTLGENLRWGNAQATDADMYRALDIAQARSFVDQKGEGLDLAIEQEGRNLSGGQKQRLTIARALVRRPDILILDDSASALDFATDAALRKSIRTEGGARTVILVSQRVSTIRGADQILVLDDGHLAGSGTHRELLHTCEVYREICASQLTAEEIARDSG